VATEGDPDYYEGNFWVWYYHFAKQYVTLWQILLMAITYNLLKLVFPMENLIAFWIVPSILATFQLFYFGTYEPHKGEHAPENVHKARSQAKNHLWAFLTCYFFGYHYEHHDSPSTPWWLLYQKKATTPQK
jgi:beta-carotene ketolase (CrtW type)